MIKAIVGADHTFVWRALVPVTAVPTCTVKLPAGDQTPAMAVVHAPITITAIDAARQVLTASAPVVAAAGLQRLHGDAFLVTDDDGWRAVRVTQINGSAISLAERVPNDLALANTAQLVFATWVATFPSGTITAAKVRDVVVTVAYAPNEGANAPTRTPPPWRDLLYVVDQPFATGLDHHALVRMLPSLARSTQARQGDFSEQIEAALVELAGHVRRDAPSGLSEDDVDGAPLLQTHGYLTAALILEATDAVASERYRARALGQRDPASLRRIPDGLYHLAMASIWTDADQDGTPDAGETGANLVGPSVEAAGNFDTSRTPQFDVGDSW